MKLIKTNLEGLKIFEPDVYEDKRGLFLETFHEERYRDFGIKDNFLQDNHSRSYKGVIRGMHFQVGNPQSQLITVLRGKIFDVCVDIRKESKTYTQWYGIELSDEGPRQIYMPGGFAHGFLCLSDFADITYKVSTLYDPTSEAGFHFSDPDISIKWPFSEDPIILDRDSLLPLFKDSEAY